MKGASARARLARAAALARKLDLAPDRGARFREPGTTPIALTELRAWPRWPGEPEAEQARIFGVTSLRASDDALREVISGDTLRSYAAKLGEDLLELILARSGQGAAPLPSADALTAAGRAHAHKALPPRLAARFGTAVAQNPDAARHVAEAEALVARVGAAA